jgi:hypothetical protein
MEGNLIWMKCVYRTQLPHHRKAASHLWIYCLHKYKKDWYILWAKCRERFWFKTAGTSNFDLKCDDEETWVQQLMGEDTWVQQLMCEDTWVQQLMCVDTWLQQLMCEDTWVQQLMCEDTWVQHLMCEDTWLQQLMCEYTWLQQLMCEDTWLQQLICEDTWLQQLMRDLRVRAVENVPKFQLELLEFLNGPALKTTKHTTRITRLLFSRILRPGIQTDCCRG